MNGRKRSKNPHWIETMLAGALVLISAGCITVGPDYETPETPTPDAWGEVIQRDFSGETPALEEWWTVFGDPKLDRLIRMAGEGNLDLKTAVARVEEARALRTGAASRWYPNLEGIGVAQATRISESTFPNTFGRDRESGYYDIGFGVGWELDFWGRIRRMVESADAALQADIESYRDGLVLLYAEVALNYAQVRTLQQRIRYLQNNAKIQEESVQLTRNRRDAGLAPDLDVRQAELNLAQTQAAIPALRIELAQAVHRLGVLTGKDPQTFRDFLLNDESPIPDVPEEVAVGIPADLLRQRPDVRRAERLLAAQNARIGVATAELYPAFSLPGTFTLEAYEGGDLFKAGSLQYGLGPAFRWNLFTAGRVRSLIRAEEARTRQALFQYQQTVLLAVEEVENAMVSLAEQRRREQKLVQAVEAARQSSALARTLYENGLTDFQNVLDMQRSLTAQQDALAQSRGRVTASLILLYKALGGGWDVPDPAGASENVPLLVNPEGNPRSDPEVRASAQ